MKRYRFIIPEGAEELSGNFLCRELDKSEAEIKKLMRQGSVWLNNRRFRSFDFPFPAGSLEIFYPDKPVHEYTLNPKLIRYEDGDILIIWKEGGVNSCPSPFSDRDCLTWGVQKYLDPEENTYSVSAIHRLDKPAHGLIFFAKNKTAETALHRMFLERKVKKLYLVMTPPFTPNRAVYHFRDVIEWRGKSKEAKTWVKYLYTREEGSYFLAYPLTGRPHQIRKHFASYLRPIIGDAQYGGYSSADELKLACVYYRFRHPVTDEKMEIQEEENAFRNA